MGSGRQVNRLMIFSHVVADARRPRIDRDAIPFTTYLDTAVATAARYHARVPEDGELGEAETTHDEEMGSDGEAGSNGNIYDNGYGELDGSTVGGSGKDGNKDSETLVSVDRFLPPTTLARIPRGSGRHSSDKDSSSMANLSRQGKTAVKGASAQPDVLVHQHDIARQLSLLPQPAGVGSATKGCIQLDGGRSEGISVVSILDNDDTSDTFHTPLYCNLLASRSPTSL